MPPILSFPHVKEFEDTNDTVTGRPTVYVKIIIGHHEICADEAAMIDTGASISIIHPVLLAGFHDLPAPTKGQHLYGQGMAIVDHYPATISINGLERKHDIQMATNPQLPPGCLVLVGRDVLQYYRLIYDPPAGLFTLESTAP